MEIVGLASGLKLERVGDGLHGRGLDVVKTTRADLALRVDVYAEWFKDVSGVGHLDDVGPRGHVVHHEAAVTPEMEATDELRT